MVRNEVGKFPFITPDEMEQITQNILHDYGFDFAKKNYPEAIPIDEIIEFHFGLDIQWDRIDHFDTSGLVMAAIIPRDKKIIMNESCKELFEEKIGTMNFTMAHELGHWVLHVNDKENLQTQMDFNDSETFFCRSWSKKPREEYQADMFAGALLMPKPLMQKVISNLKAQGKIQMKQLYWLAPLFKVSISALTVRLKQLDLLYIDADGNIFDSRSESQGQIILDI
ncbi:ImmA/IrrE family metallo-endopeptidase [Cohnella cellulosilytica]|uniref:ImmA/IrrE family metallo-endopeptidase n=2 Tax=Cohnella cellulosilytica TaxID=986710 RepID=A0ABW2FBF1_9BACL